MDNMLEEESNKRDIARMRQKMQMDALRYDPLGSADRERDVNVAVWGAEGQKGAGSVAQAVKAAGEGANEAQARPQAAALAALADEGATKRVEMGETGATGRAMLTDAGNTRRTGMNNTSAFSRLKFGEQAQTGRQLTQQSWQTGESALNRLARLWEANMVEGGVNRRYNAGLSSAQKTNAMTALSNMFAPGAYSDPPEMPAEWQAYFAKQAGAPTPETPTSGGPPAPNTPAGEAIITILTNGGYSRDEAIDELRKRNILR